MTEPLHPSLHPDKLIAAAAVAVHQASLRFHEMPAKDLPAVAMTLLDLAARLRAPAETPRPVNPPKPAKS